VEKGASAIAAAPRERAREKEREREGERNGTLRIERGRGESSRSPSSSVDCHIDEEWAIAAVAAAGSRKDFRCFGRVGRARGVQQRGDSNARIGPHFRKRGTLGRDLERGEFDSAQHHVGNRHRHCETGKNDARADCGGEGPQARYIETIRTR